MARDKDGNITVFSGDEKFLSNFEPAKVKLDGDFYPTVEHAYQAAKTLDHGWRLAIMTRPTASGAKYQGRHCPLRPNWEEMKVGIMRDLIAQKFAPGTKYAELLVATGNVTIAEGNWWGDRFWGRTFNRNTGEWTGGLNWLGELLMRQREALNGH